MATSPRAEVVGESKSANGGFLPPEGEAQRSAAYGPRGPLDYSPTEDHFGGFWPLRNKRDDYLAGRIPRK